MQKKEIALHVGLAGVILAGITACGPIKDGQQLTATTDVPCYTTRNGNKPNRYTDPLEVNRLVGFVPENTIVIATAKDNDPGGANIGDSLRIVAEVYHPLAGEWVPADAELDRTWEDICWADEDLFELVEVKP